MNRTELIRQLNLSGVGIEVGVQKGKFSKVILENSNLYLYLLDAWRYFESGYIGVENVESKKHISRMSITVETLLPYEGRFTLIRDTSENGSKLFQNEFFDFVYVDANHSYEECLKDLEIWYPKLKRGGILAGHDYTTILPSIDVKRAVDDFVKKHELTIDNVTDGRFPSFSLKKV